MENLRAVNSLMPIIKGPGYVIGILIRMMHAPSCSLSPLQTSGESPGAKGTYKTGKEEKQRNNKKKIKSNH